MITPMSERSSVLLRRVVCMMGGLVLAGSAQGAGAVDISIACGGGGDGDYCPQAAQAWAGTARGGTRIA